MCNIRGPDRVPVHRCVIPRRQFDGRGQVRRNHSSQCVGERYLLDRQGRNLPEDGSACLADAQGLLVQSAPRVCRSRASRTAIVSRTREMYAVGTR